MQDHNEPASSGPVDFDRLREITDGDDALRDIIVAQYFEQAEEILAGMEQAAHAGSVGEVSRLAHKLVGSSATCGMIAVMPPLRALEALPSGQAAEVLALYRQTTEQMERIRQALAGAG